MPAAETSPWDEFVRGDIVEIDCRDDARNLQGQGLIIIKDILQGKRGRPSFGVGEHIGASDCY